MVNPIEISDFVSLNQSVPLVDVRTPAEFMQGHVPGAYNIPLFTNEERIAVGTTYKQVGKEEAILLGFDLTGGKWSTFIQQALTIAPKKKIAVHCWRGGMRSGAMAWALNLYGFEVFLITGGYKSYRKWTLKQFEKTYELRVIGGMTGSNKTKLLHEIKYLQKQVIDLEDLAQHQGSSYGTMNRLVQPTQEQFENDFAYQLSQLDSESPIWVEDESLTIGKRCIPHPFWNQMRNSFLINLIVSLEKRIEILSKEYGQLNKDFLVECTERIKKRLGPEQTKNAVLAIRENRMADFVRFVLAYYDKTYNVGLNKRKAEQVFSFNITHDELTENARKILDFASIFTNIKIDQ